MSAQITELDAIAASPPLRDDADSGVEDSASVGSSDRSTCPPSPRDALAGFEVEEEMRRIPLTSSLDEEDEEKPDEQKPEKKNVKIAETEAAQPKEVKEEPIRRKSSYSLAMNTLSTYGDDPLVFPKPIAWDWPFCDEGVARGVFTEEKFMICLPFNNGGTGDTSGSTKKFEKISECNFSWTIGLSNSGEFGNGFWRMELEIIRNLNMLALIVSRDISRVEEPAKRLKRVRKVYRLPDHYDVRTLTSRSFDWAIVLEAQRRYRPRRGSNAVAIGKIFRRSATFIS